MILYGTQIVSKFNLPSNQADKVMVFMALWRIKSKSIDLVLTMNVPIGKVNEESISVENKALESQVEATFSKAVKSLVIEDFSLFA